LPQARELLQAARGNRLEALYVLAVTTGMRHGELLGLG
jgi:integrase